MTEPQPVALNDVADLVRLLRENNLARFLTESLAAGGCGTMCDCNDSKCACRGSVTAVKLEADLAPVELEALKQERIKELRAQIEEAERQIAEAESGPGS